ncbi:MAG: glycosyltransferase family 2 protein [Maricaulaceae bacterium]
MPPAVTILLSTYNRAEMLSRVIRTVRAQTREDWLLWVIGDHCTDDTEARVAAFDDPRITMINLPERFGEQAGPNSVGMALAETEFVAFLNHDDYWLPNHLETALRALETTDADMVWTRAAAFQNRGPRTDRAFFTTVSPLNRTLADAYCGTSRYLEPTSTWVARRSLLNRVGPFRLSNAATLRPLRDYVKRLLDAGCVLHADPVVTVLNDWMTVLAAKNETAPPIYALSGEFAETWLQQIEAGDVTGLLEDIEQDVWLATHLGMALDLSAELFPMSRHWGDAYETTGLDAVELAFIASGRKAGRPLEELTRRLSGDAVFQPPDLDAVIAAVRARL